MKRALGLKAVSKQVGRGAQARFILEGTSCSFEAGQVTVITGPSGSGKSTLLALCGGLSRPESGAVQIGEHTITKDTGTRELIRVRQNQVGFLFQNSGLVNALTALDNVRMPLAYAKLDAHEQARRSMDALDRYGLADRASVRAAALSGGERHRVALARVAAQRAPWIICDEPTTGLDPDWVSQVLEDLKAHTSDGTGVLVASHDDRVIHAAHSVIDMGELSHACETGA